MGDDTKINESLSKLIIKPAFQNDVRKIRTEFFIPEDGFTSYEESREWLSFLKTGGKNFIPDDDAVFVQEAKFLSTIVNLLSSYKVPPTVLSATVNYVLSSNRYDTNISKNSFACAIQSPRFDNNELSVERYWDAKRVNYTRLLIHEFASKADVLSYVKDNWVEIERSISPIKKPKPRIRKRTKATEHDIVFRVYNELKDGTRLTDKLKTYPEIQISKILNDEFQIELDPDNIRKIISTETKRRK